jgi:hypothetical protein
LHRLDPVRHTRGMALVLVMILAARIALIVVPAGW